MKITVTFDSLEEFAAHMRPQEGFEPEPVQEKRNVFEEAKQKVASIMEVDTGTGTLVGEPAELKASKAEDAAPFEEKTEEQPAVTEDYRIEVRKLLAKLNKKTGQNTAKKLIQQFGAGKLADVKLEDLPALMAKAEEAYNAG